MKRLLSGLQGLPGAYLPFAKQALQLLGMVGLIVAAGWLLPQDRQIPVKSATTADWNPASFWHYPWGRSITHKGIDIFAKTGTPVLAASPGWIVHSGYNDIGGLNVLVLGAKWRLYYYAHLQKITAHTGQWRNAGDLLGTVGDTGNAHGKSPHLHFSIASLIPMPDRFDVNKPQAGLTMFYVDPHEFLTGKGQTG